MTKKLDWIIKVMKKDERNSFVMRKNGTFSKEKGTFDSHEYMIKNKA